MSDLDLAVDENGEYLAGQLLVAMPSMRDPRFHKTVIYMCAHNADGAMGLVVNRALESLSFPDMLEQLEIDASGVGEKINVHLGCPVYRRGRHQLHDPLWSRAHLSDVDAGPV